MGAAGRELGGQTRPKALGRSAAKRAAVLCGVVAVSTAESDCSDSDLSDCSSSRHSNQNKSVNSATADSEEIEKKVKECYKEFCDALPVKSKLPIAAEDGRKIRRDYATIETAEWEADMRLGEDREKYTLDRPTGTTDGDVKPFAWKKAVKVLLERYGEVEKRMFGFEKRHMNQTEDFKINPKLRWSQQYQKRYAAQIGGWLRELTGGERPSGGQTAASYNNPHIALITRSASSRPDGERVPPCDHMACMADSWNDVYHAMRNTLRSLGVSADEWSYDRRAEPHTNDKGNKQGVNAGYTHEHIVLVVDKEVEAADLRPIVDKHVSVCEWAKEDAHGESAIEVSTPDELHDVAAYVSDYASIAPKSLFERSADYIGWAAAATAMRYRTVTRSESAVEAAKADKCRQRYESDKSEQSDSHGESIRYANGEIVCEHCETTHDIDQSQPMAAHRRPERPTQPTVADGGDELNTNDKRREELRERWADAAAGATVGESPDRERARKRLQGVVHAHEDKTDLELAAKYFEKPLEYLDIVRQVRSDAETDPSKVVSFRRRSAEHERETWENERERVPWRLRWIYTEDADDPQHVEAAGGSVPMVSIDRFELDDGPLDSRFDFLELGEWYRCGCGIRLKAENMALHVSEEHGIDKPHIAEEEVAIETYNQEESAPGHKADKAYQAMTADKQPPLSERVRFLKRDTEFKEAICKAIALSERGYTESGIAGKVGVTKGTVSNWLDKVEDRHGLEAVMPKMPNKRGSLSSVGSSDIC